MNTGHDGGMTTIHANDARDAIGRLEMLIGMAAPELPMWFIHRQIAAAIHIVVQTARLSGGARKITQISEVTGMQGDAISMHDIFSYQQTGVSGELEADGYFQATGIRPECLVRLQRTGTNLPLSFFERGPRDIERVDTLAARTGAL
jgi:pilus assembly protein CpaF